MALDPEAVVFALRGVRGGGSGGGRGSKGGVRGGGLLVAALGRREERRQVEEGEDAVGLFLARGPAGCQAGGPAGVAGVEGSLSADEDGADALERGLSAPVSLFCLDALELGPDGLLLGCLEERDHRRERRERVADAALEEELAALGALRGRCRGGCCRGRRRRLGCCLCGLGFGLREGAALPLLLAFCLLGVGESDKHIQLAGEEEGEEVE